MKDLTEEEYKKVMRVDQGRQSVASAHLASILEHRGDPYGIVAKEIGISLQRLRDIIYGAINITEEDCLILADWSKLRFSFWRNLSFYSRLKIHNYTGDTEEIIRTSNGGYDVAIAKKNGVELR